MLDIFERVFLNKDEELTCENCDRELPNDTYFTEHGCIWCTIEKENK